ncbi:MAG TPA: helix-turn-helix domain-containing protein [Geminicoccus sp.]|jgi:excisionase family DNA binding protein|uniref:helix-turn-helix domain-containing protein n=1 Tax=Geminicoccus sp. TaxID=2024832 RepID=UPI002E332233|nr:helix-turn-helix domain-containing protein [Geminicoccus sp.]HEX2526960.1 helix-turn-helix domain-containing protein [Geminicoccus sp.]
MDLEDLRHEPISVRVPDAARITGISRSVLYELIKTNELETVKIGRARLVPVASLRKLISKNVTKSAA